MQFNGRKQVLTLTFVTTVLYVLSAFCTYFCTRKVDPVVALSHKQPSSLHDVLVKVKSTRMRDGFRATAALWVANLQP